MRRALIAAFVILLPTVASAETLNLYAAGSLRAALTEIVRAFEAKNGGLKVEAEFAASGLLRERIEKGEAVHVFASADMGHPQKLADAELARTQVGVFARNQLCALVRAGLSVTSATLLDAMLDPGVRLGTSTPKADPSGDYAFALFAKAEARIVGAKAKLEAKALQLTGGPSSEKAPAGRNQYGWVMESGQADIFLTPTAPTPCWLAKSSRPCRSCRSRPELNVGADYGMIVLKSAPIAADKLAAFIRSGDGQAILAGYGFGRGDAP